MPKISFPKARRRLLEVLAQCPAGVWLSTASLVEHLRLNDPGFLIPIGMTAGDRPDPLCKGRYGNFIERKRGDWGHREPISDKDPEAFAKVEGRYVERFLEGAPLVLGYTEVAYLKSRRESEIEPWRGLVPAFRVTERLRQALRREIAAPKVTVLPNFEVHVESLFFPAQVDAELRTLGELVQRGIVSVFKLTKARVAATLAADSEANVILALESLSGRPLPANVREELEDWAGHSEKFVLYEGFGLLEGPHDGPDVSAFVVEKITPNLAVVQKAERLHRELEAAEQVPIRIRHSERKLAVPAEVKSCLSPSVAPRRVPSKKPIKLKRSTQTTLWFADAEAHAAFAKILLDAKSAAPIDRRALTISYSPQAEPLVRECLKKFGQEFAVTIDEVEN